MSNSECRQSPHDPESMNFTSGNVLTHDFSDIRFGERNSETVRFVDEMQPLQLALSSEWLSNLSIEEEVVATYSLVDYFRRDREISRNGVHFGSLEISSVLDQSIPEYVAVKPYDRQRVRLPDAPARLTVHEMAANNYVTALTGYRSTYEPIGVLKNRANVPALITKFREPSKTLDLVFKTTGAKAESTSDGKVAKTLGLGFLAAGFLHGAGLASGDFQPRNVGRLHNGVIMFPDLTTLSRLSTVDGHIVSNKGNLKKTRTDIEDFALFALDPAQITADMVGKLRSVMSSDEIIKYVADKYYEGMRWGGKRSGLEIDEKLVASEEYLRDLLQERVAASFQNDYDNEPKTVLASQRQVFRCR